MLKNFTKKAFHKLGLQISRRSPVDAFSQKQEIIWHNQCNYYNTNINKNYNLDSQVRSEFESNSVKQLTIEEILLMSAITIDVTDAQLGKVSQLEHSLQLASLLREKGDNWILAALLHDLGKCASLIHSKFKSSIFGAASLIDFSNKYTDERCLNLSYSHSEWAYLRFKSKITDETANLIRYHNVCPKGMDFILQTNPSLARDLSIFREAEKFSKDKFGNSVTYHEALDYLTTTFDGEYFPV